MTETSSRPLARPTRRGFMGGAAAAGLALAPEVAVGRGKGHRDKGFVQVRGSSFVLDKKPFRFGGTNTYYLHQRSRYMIDAALDDAAAMGPAAVRCWAFADGPGNELPLQPAPFEHDEDNVDSLDYAVWKASQLGLKLVLALTNNWPDYGAMQQYVKWFLGLPDDGYGDAVNHDRFYTDARIRDCYKAYARHVIRRRNRYTGLRYLQDPTIMTFELANEPRNRSDKSGSAALSWAREMSAWVKHLAPRQLVAIGDEGFHGRPGHSDYPYSDYEGNRWLELLNLPAVDYGTVHPYPQHGGRRHRRTRWSGAGPGSRPTSETVTGSASPWSSRSTGWRSPRRRRFRTPMRATAASRCGRGRSSRPVRPFLAADLEGGRRLLLPRLRRLPDHVAQRRDQPLALDGAAQRARAPDGPALRAPVAHVAHRAAGSVSRPDKIR